MPSQTLLPTEGAKALAELIADMRSDPIRFKAFKDSVDAAKTDAEKAQLLVDFATDVASLTTKMPNVERHINPAGSITTIAITTTIT